MKPISKLLFLTFLGNFLIQCTMHLPNSSTPLPKYEMCRSSSQQAAFEIDALLNEAYTDMAFWGVKIQYANSGEVIYERNMQKMFMPASNMKLYTTAAALCLLGPQYRYRTGFYTNGSIDENGVLHGDLIIRGSGDPTWSWRFFDDNHDSLYVRFADSLYARGIRSITGDIIGDDDVFDDQVLGWDWAWDDEPYYYAAQLSGLSYHENYIDFTLIPDSIPGNGVILEASPNTSYMTIRNDLVSVNSDTSTEWDYGRERGTNEGWFEGDYRIKDGKKERALTVENPTLFAVWVLKEYLQAAGIEVRGVPVDADEWNEERSYNEWNLLFNYDSHPLSDIITKVNRPSQNFIAETLQKTLGHEFGEEGSSREGQKVELALFDSLGMDTRNLQIQDGSGLSRRNLVSPNNTVSLLDMMWHHPYREYYLESLPLAGVTNGTLEKRMLRSIAQGNVRAKTGYIGYVRSLSGYTWTRSGEPIIFSIMVNHYTIPTSRINKIQDRIVTRLSSIE